MKTCNNCGSNNQLEAQRCFHCQMSGDFSYADQPAEAIAPVKINHCQCTNCGEQQPADAEQCDSCRFPLVTRVRNSKPQPSALPDDQKSVSESW